MSVITEGLVPSTGDSICDFCSSQEVFQVYMAGDFTAVELAAPDGHPVPQFDGRLGRVPRVRQAS